MRVMLCVPNLGAGLILEQSCSESETTLCKHRHLRSPTVQMSVSEVTQTVSPLFCWRVEQPCLVNQELGTCFTEEYSVNMKSPVLCSRPAFRIPENMMFNTPVPLPAAGFHQHSHCRPGALTPPSCASRPISVPPSHTCTAKHATQECA